MLDQLETFLRKGKRGDTLAYHYGFLMRDREKGRTGWKTVDAIAATAWAAYRSGLVVLTQRRGGPARFSYVATHL